MKQLDRPGVLLSRYVGVFGGLLFAGVVIALGGHAARDAFEREGRHAAEQLAAAARDAVLRDDRAALERFALLALNEGATRHAALSGREGELLATVQRDIAPMVPRAEPTATLVEALIHPGLTTRFHAPIQYRDPNAPDAAPSVLGWASVRLSPVEFARQHEAFSPTLTTALVGSLSIIGFSVVLGIRRRRLLQRMHLALGQLRAGHLYMRVEATGRGELEALATAIDDVAASLQHAQRDLESQVQRTTSELRQTLEAVEIQNVELDLARKRALEASKVKSEFLANMSHEIRTPINGIVGFADLLAHSPLDEDQRDYVNTIKDSCANLLTIVNDILDFSKIEAGKLAIDSVAFDLRDSVEEVLSLLAPTAYGKALELVHLIYTDVPLKLYGDPIRIRQVLTNLVHNAIKFTPSGRVVVRIMLEDENEQDALLRVAVADTGIGLSKDDQAKLFTAFGQADTSITRRFGGAGLGLIISRKLVEQMGGAIGFESEHGRGSTFWFTLRCLRQRGNEPAEDTEQPLRGKRILIYDEDGLSRLALKHTLESWGIQVTDVDDRHRFISLAGAQSRWDLMVVGLNRAELNARTFHGLMPRLHHIQVPILVLASTVDRNELRSLYQQGARAALPKALRRQTLYREIFRVIDDSSESPPSTLRESLPAPIDDHADALSTRARPPSGLRVLVVDDNEINRKLMSTILSIYGAEVLEAEDGKAALDLALAHPVDLIFMDIHMPTMSGETATQLIREQTPADQTPRIIALTANAMPGEHERLLAAGMDDCLIKPISEGQVAQILEDISLAKQAAKQPAAASPVDGREAPSPAPSQPAQPPPVQGLKSTKSDMLEELREMLLAELPSHKKGIQQAYRANDPKQLKDRVHTLHGAASVCHQERLRRACATLESALGNDDLVAVPGGVRAVLHEIDALSSATGKRAAPPVDTALD